MKLIGLFNFYADKKCFDLCIYISVLFGWADENLLQDSDFFKTISLLWSLLIALTWPLHWLGSCGIVLLNDFQNSSELSYCKLAESLSLSHSLDCEFLENTNINFLTLYATVTICCTHTFTTFVKMRQKFSSRCHRSEAETWLGDYLYQWMLRITIRILPLVVFPV